MKTENYYGVEMTMIQGFKFSIYKSRPENPSMNTLTKEERFEFAQNWLKNIYSETFKNN